MSAIIAHAERLTGQQLVTIVNYLVSEVKVREKRHQDTQFGLLNYQTGEYEQFFGYPLKHLLEKKSLPIEIYF